MFEVYINLIGKLISSAREIERIIPSFTKSPCSSLILPSLAANLTSLNLFDIDHSLLNLYPDYLGNHNA